MRTGRMIGIALAMSMLAPLPARALPPPPFVVFEGTLQVCEGIDESGCTYGTDVFWSGDTWMRQGLYHPTFGPPVTSGPVRMTSVTAVCPAAATCALSLEGTVGPHGLLDVGAYCETHEIELHGRLTGGGVDMLFNFTWSNPGGPVEGEAIDTIHPGTRRVTGLLGARGSPTAGDCGVDAPMTSLQVEGVLVFS